ncbi:MAG: tRNA-binding protein [Bacteroidetes bacterium]|nr:MAG: tRNA-binding protein [Bacteroidota bacterium]
MEKIKNEISWSTFEMVDIRVGTIIKTEDFPEARKPAYKIWVDLGPLGVKKSSAQVTEHYTVSELIGKQVVCIVNFGEKQIGPFLSQVLISGFPDENGSVILTTVDKKAPNGAKLF